MVPPVHDRRAADREPMPSDEEIDSWPSWQRLVLTKIGDLEKRVGTLDDKLTEILLEQAAHKGKMMVIGGLAAAAVTVILESLFHKGR